MAERAPEVRRGLALRAARRAGGSHAAMELMPRLSRGMSIWKNPYKPPVSRGAADLMLLLMRANVPNSEVLNAKGDRGV